MGTKGEGGRRGRERRQEGGGVAPAFQGGPGATPAGRQAGRARAAYAVAAASPPTGARCFFYHI